MGQVTVRVLVCGSRSWRDKTIMKALIKGLGPKTVVIHGGADGADRLAGWVADELHLEQIVERADWNRYGKGAGVIRNQVMLDQHRPDLVLAFRSYGKSRGTDDMVRRAEAASVETFVISGGPRPAEPPMHGGGRPDPDLFD